MQNKQRITTNILQIIKNKQERNKAVFVYSPNEIEDKQRFFLYKGDKISEFHMDMIFPIEPKCNVIYL